MTHLTILDYNSGQVFIYNVKDTIEINDDFIEELGFKLSEISYMTTKELKMQWRI